MLLAAGASQQGATAEQGPALTWACRRFWFGPAPHAMLHHGGVLTLGSRIMLFQTSLAR